MKNLVCLLGMLVLLSAACSKDDAETPVPSYELLSIEYDVVKITPAFKSDPATVYRNEGAVVWDINHSYESKHGFTSRFEFDMPQDGNLTDCCVRVPKVGNDGTLNDYSFEEIPFAPGDFSAVDTSLRDCGGPSLPPRAQFRIVVTHRIYDVTAAFVCRLRNSVSDAVEEVRGNWFGEWYYGEETYCKVSDLE